MEIEDNRATITLFMKPEFKISELKVVKEVLKDLDGYVDEIKIGEDLKNDRNRNNTFEI